MPTPALHPDTVVVGAGIAGLACAALLAEMGLKVLVVESSDAPGGRARSWRHDATGDTIDIGPHILLNKYANMRALLRRLGTEAQVHWQTEELLTVLDKGRHIHFRVGGLPAPLHYLRNLPRILPSVPLGQLLSNVPVAWRTMRSTPADILSLDNENGRDYLLRCGVSPAFIDWFWASASIALLNLPVQACSAAALMRLFSQMLGHNDVAFGIPKVGLSDLYAWPCVRIIEGSGQVRCRCAARAVVWEHGRASGIVLADGSRVDAPVVLAVPPTAVPPLLPAAHPMAALARRFAPSPYVSCFLWFDRKITTSPFWARPWSPAAYNTDFYDLSNVRPTVPGAGSLVATNIIWSHRVDDCSDGQLIDATLKEIAEFSALAGRATLLATAVHRIPMSVPCARPGIETIRPPTRWEPGLFLAGDWVDTGLPFCMESATRAGALAAEAVLAELGRPRTLALPPPVPGGLTRLLRRRSGDR
ncbi:hydroxysqualene dehydroxylase [Bordetella genomosp. 9]|uniref:Amine oxidase domain-containing protein n=1 Tax=Bordetella genomosp. 9 TaxID=1416803 RepID=A0A1W6YZX4_9BORD|nr:FAD-dependent oxidoreductase [Bordetella genomosp. 9]ARP86640.1 hypothetical protein CAL13_10790 [Bordetella genomosp. 9]